MCVCVVRQLDVNGLLSSVASQVAATATAMLVASPGARPSLQAVLATLRTCCGDGEGSERRSSAAGHSPR